MKKLLLVLLIIVLAAIVVRKFGLLNYFSKTPGEPLIKKQEADTSSVKPSQEVDRPPIGIYYKMIDKQTADQNGLVEGAYITRVIKGSPAESADLREEDIITQFDDRKILGSDELKILTGLVTDKNPGDTVKLKIWRNKKIIDIPIILQPDK